MFVKELFNRLVQHLSSLTVAVIALVVYVIGSPEWLEKYIHIEETPVFPVFVVTLILLVYELSLKNHKFITTKVKNVDGKIDNVLKQMEINRLVHSVNALYSRFVDSNDEWITHEYTIKELAELTDMRNRLGINSYIQARLNFLNSKIKLGK